MHDTTWLFNLLQQKVQWLDRNLNDQQKEGVSIERSMIQRLDDFKNLAENLKSVALKGSQSVEEVRAIKKSQDRN
jgi:hypothetical protein